MIIVSDTTSLHYLVLIDAAAVLPALYGRVLIPEGVRAELLHPHAPAVVRRWAQALPEWIEVRKASDLDLEADLGRADRDRGEREAISLALEHNTDLVLLDDRKARRVAVERGLRVTGTLGILEAAAARGLQEPDSIQRLRRAGFRASVETLRTAYERAEARWQDHRAGKNAQNGEDHRPDITER